MHRWIALTLGLLLVVVSTSGALIVYEPEMLRASNAELFHTTLDTTLDGEPVGFVAAMDAVADVDPEFSAADMSLKDGVYLVASAEGDGATYFVDAGIRRGQRAEQPLRRCRRIFWRICTTAH